MSPDALPSRPPQPDRHPRSPERTAVKRFLLVYVPLALVWIVGTDFLVASLADDIANALWLEILKGTLFVAVTAGVLHAVTRSTLQEWDRRNAIFRGVVEDAPDLIVRVRSRPNLSFDYVSPAPSGLAGYGPEDLYEDPELILRAVHPEDADALRELLTAPSPEDRTFALRWIHKEDASTVWTEARVKWEYDEVGRPVAALAVVRDATARYQAERSARLLATAVEAAGEAVLVTDTEGVIEYVNPSFERLSGYSAAEAVGRTPRILNSGRQPDSFFARLWSTLRSGGSFRGQFLNRRKDGTLYEQQTTITPVVDERGEPTHFVSVSRDVTVEREIDRQIATSEKASAVAQLASGMSHDFRNLLNVVLVNSEFLRDACPDNPELDGQISDMQAAVAGGIDLVTRLLNIARPDGAAERMVVDLNTVLTDMEGILRAAVARSVDLVLTPWGRELRVRIDRVQIEQALLNLARNASQAMPEGGVLEIAAARVERLPEGVQTTNESGDPDAPYARLVVTDTGSGMDAEALARVYDPFFTTKETGTGLGVPMVQRTVHEHGGSITFESEVGVGTTVTAYLPLVEAHAEVATPESVTETPSPASGGERILLVEDDDGLRRTAERALMRLGYDVTTATDGLEAIRLIEAGDRWDLLLTDMMMPGLGGAELYRRLEERDIRMSVIFMSGQTPELIAGFTSGGAVTGFLQKPWSLQSLASTVREALEAHTAPAAPGDRPTPA